MMSSAWDQKAAVNGRQETPTGRAVRLSSVHDAPELHAAEALECFVASDASAVVEHTKQCVSKTCPVPDPTVAANQTLARSPSESRLHLVLKPLSSRHGPCTLAEAPICCCSCTVRRGSATMRQQTRVTPVHMSQGDSVGGQRRGAPAHGRIRHLQRRHDGATHRRAAAAGDAQHGGVADHERRLRHIHAGAPRLERHLVASHAAALVALHPPGMLSVTVK